MKKFNYREVDQELMVPEVMNLVSTIHGYKGKQELFMKAKPDILKSMLEVAKVQSTGASNRIEVYLQQIKGWWSWYLKKQSLLIEMKKKSLATEKF